MTSQADEALQVAKTFVAAMAGRDGKGMSAALHEDVVCESPFPLVKGENGPGTKWAQGESVHAHCRNIANVIASMEFKNVTWRTTNDGLAMFQADGDATLPSGKPYCNHYLMLFQVKNGKIAHWYEYYSPVIAARANGLPLDIIP